MLHKEKIFFLVSILPGITLFQQYCFPSNFNNPSLLPSLHSHAALVEAFFPMNRLVRTTVLPSYIRYSNRVVNVVNPPTSSSALSLRDDFIDAEIIGDEGSIQRREESNDGKPKKNISEIVGNPKPTVFQETYIGVTSIAL